MEKLRVWYGLRKLTPKVVKRPSITIVFENGYLWKNEASVNRMMKVLHCRFQTKEEMQYSDKCTRVFSVWEIYLDDTQFKGNIEKVIEFNSFCDRNQVSEEERVEIADKIRNEIYDFYNIKPSTSPPAFV